MRCIISLLLLLATHYGYSQSRELNVLQLEKDRFKAMIGKDSIALERILANDLLYIHSNGVIDSKETLIKNIMSGKVEYLIDRLHRLAHGIAIANVALQQSDAAPITAAQPLIVPFGTLAAEIIEDENLGALSRQPIRQIRSDETNSTGDQDALTGTARDKRHLQVLHRCQPFQALYR